MGKIIKEIVSEIQVTFPFKGVFAKNERGIDLPRKIFDGDCY